MGLIETKEVKFYSDASDFPATGNEVCVSDGKIYVVSGGRKGVTGQAEFSSMAEFTAAGGAAANPGPVWIGQKSFSPSGRPAKQIAKNILATGHADQLTATKSETFTGWNTPNQTGGATVVRSTATITNDTSTIDVPLNGRGFESIPINTMGLVHGQKYAFTIYISALTGASTQGIRIYAATEATPYIPIVTSNNNKRIGMIFTYDANSGTQYIRVGSGVNNVAASGDVMTATFTDPSLVPVTTDNKFYSYTPRELAVDYLPGCTFDADNSVVESRGAHIGYVSRSKSLVMLTGDSYTNDAIDFPQLANVSTGFVIESYGYAGGLLSGAITDNFATNLAKNSYDIAAIQGGINELTSSTDYITAMQSDLTAACNTCENSRIPVVLFDVPPHADIGANAAKTTRWQYWNAWISQFALDRGYPLVPLSTLLADPSGLLRINPAYVSGIYTGNYTYTGDVTHPTQGGGMDIIADALAKAASLVA